MKIKIALDAGHGSDTAGKRSFDESFFEYEFNRDIARRVNAYLETYGISVLLTAPEDEDVSLSSRCKASDNYGADLLVSFHANAYGTTWNTANGMEVYYASGSTKGLQLATCIHEKLDALGLRDRGVKATTEFTMCCKPEAPAILIEHFFYTNTTELTKCNTDEFREQFAIADSKGILEYLGITWVEKSITTTSSSHEEEEVVRYNQLSDIPNDYKFRDIVDKLMRAKVINGDGSDATGNEDVIDLSHDMLRVLVFNYNAGIYDTKLKDSGISK